MVARRFGGSASKLKMVALSGEQGSQNVTSKEAGSLINGLMGPGGASQDLSATRKPFRRRFLG